MAVKPKQNHSGNDSVNGNGHRIPGRKVKSGCQTCKRRKVKCDETWPVCHRCESTGRICDGYGIWGGGSRTLSQSYREPPSPTSTELTRSRLSSSTSSTGSSPTRCIQMISFQSGEQECFEWYMHRSATKLSGAFHASHWTTLLFQASTTESSIRHAMLALASAHKEEVRGDGYSGHEFSDDQALFTIGQYSKAIKGLQTWFADGRRASMHVALISCALFIPMEYLRGNYTNALVHLEYGLGLLQETGKDARSRDPWSVGVDGWVITLFTRELVQAKLLSQIPTLPCRRFIHLYDEPTCHTFRSIHHARRSLERIMVCAFDIQEQSQNLAPTTSNKTKECFLDYERQTQNALHAWLDTHTATVAALSPTAPVTDRFTYRLLLLYYQLASILVGTCLDLPSLSLSSSSPSSSSPPSSPPSSHQLRFDDHETTFLAIITHCVWTYNLLHPNGQRNPKAFHDPESASPNSISDIGWIPPLYFTALHCRHPRIRRHALRLLACSVHKEGIWNVAVVLPVAQRVMEIEESGLYDDGDGDGDDGGARFPELDAFETHVAPTAEDLVVGGSEAYPKVSAAARVSGIRVSLPRDRAGRLGFACRRVWDDRVTEWICEEYDLRSQRWTKSAWTVPDVSSFCSTATGVMGQLITTAANENSSSAYIPQDLDELIDLPNDQRYENIDSLID